MKKLLLIVIAILALGYFSHSYFGIYSVPHYPSTAHMMCNMPDYIDNYVYYNRDKSLKFRTLKNEMVQKNNIELGFIRSEAMTIYVEKYVNDRTLFKMQSLK